MARRQAMPAVVLKYTGFRRFFEVFQVLTQGFPEKGGLAMRGSAMLLIQLAELYLYTYRQVWVWLFLCLFLPFPYGLLVAGILAYFHEYFRKCEEDALKEARKHAARNQERF